MLSYYKPTNLEEATQLKAQVPDSVFLGGGTVLNSLGWSKYVEEGRVQDYAALIDVTGLELGTVEEQDGYIRLAANIPVQDIYVHPLCPAMLRANLKQMDNLNIRNMATLGGSLGVNSPCSNSLAALLCVHAEVEVYTASGLKRIALEEYAQNKQDSDLVVAFYVPKAWVKLPCATRRYSRSQSDISIVLADVIMQQQDGKVCQISAVAGGVASHVVRLKALEKALSGQELPSAEQVAKLVAEDIAPVSDIRGGAEFKALLIGELTDWCLHNVAVQPCCDCKH